MSVGCCTLTNMVAASTGIQAQRHLNRGIYDVAEVATLIHQPRARIERWVSQDTPTIHGAPEFDGFFSFLDLISLLAVAELESRGVSETHIAAGRAYLVEALRTPWPFAHKRLATVGRQFFAELEDGSEWVDVGLGGQGAFEQLISNELRLIEYGDDELATRWHPTDHVVIDPAIQAGSPCLAGSRVSTALIWDLHQGGASLDEIADDYQLDHEQVVAAIDFEVSLHESS